MVLFCMNKTISNEWILAGYALFAEGGLAALKVETMSKRVFKSKSSFYHQFADMDFFIQQLLDYHLVRAQELADRMEALPQLLPDAGLLLVEAKEDLFFNKQLRIHRQIPQFVACFERANRIEEGCFLPLWENALRLGGNKQVAAGLFDLAVENFYLQITPENFTLQWFEKFIKEIAALVQGLQTK